MFSAGTVIYHDTGEPLEGILLFAFLTLLGCFLFILSKKEN